MTNTTTLRERFDEKFCYRKGHIMDGIIKSGINTEELFSFIESELQEAERRGREEMKKECLAVIPEVQAEFFGQEDTKMENVIHDRIRTAINSLQ